MSQQYQSTICLIVGPTAVGKSAVALQLAEQFKGGIINADSMQIYRGLDVGTAKPNHEDRRKVPHFLYDVAEPTEVVSAADYAQLAGDAIGTCVSENRLPFVVGGTGFYVQALLRGLCDTGPVNHEIRLEINELEEQKGLTFLYEQLKQVDKPMAERLMPADSARIKRALEVHATTGKTLSQWQQDHQQSGERYRCFKVGLTLDRQQLYERINRRCEMMLTSGMLDEVALFSGGPERGIGYLQASKIKRGDLSVAEATEQMAKETRNYAKRQWTWFRREPGLKWYDTTGRSLGDVAQTIAKDLRSFLAETE